MLKNAHDLLVHLAALDNGKIQILAHSRKTGVTYFQNVELELLGKNLYVMSMKYYLKLVKAALKDMYLGGTTPTALQNEVST